MSEYLHIVYKDHKQYTRQLKVKYQFNLILELSKKNRKFLLEIVHDCLENEYFFGIVFVVDKNEILFDRLFFLRDIVLKLLYSNKKAGIWGVPYCVQQQILGPYYFSQISSDLIPENSKYYSKFISTFQMESSLLLRCHQCINVAECDGLGIRIENHVMWGYRTSNKYRKIDRDILFKTDNEEMKALYDSFKEHVDNSDLRYADRYLYFVKNIDYGSTYSFSDRFVYHCDYLPLFECEQELYFLDKHIENKHFIATLDELLAKKEIGRIAYSTAKKNGVYRESFYVAPVNEKNEYLLNYFNLDINISVSHQFYGIGVDFYNNDIKSYKIYFMLTPELLLQMHPQYFEKINIDLLSLSPKLHYYIVRLDANKKRISERIDLVYEDKDRSLFQQYFDQLPFSEEALDLMHIYAFAFEFEELDIKKMNIYYRNRF